MREFYVNAKVSPISRGKSYEGVVDWIDTQWENRFVRVRFEGNNGWRQEERYYDRVRYDRRRSNKVFEGTKYDGFIDLSDRFVLLLAQELVEKRELAPAFRKMLQSGLRELEYEIGAKKRRNRATTAR